MALPGHRRTSLGRKRRAMHARVARRILTACRNCNARMQPHHACKKCGYYAGRQVVRVKTKKKN